MLRERQSCGTGKQIFCRRHAAAPQPRRAESLGREKNFIAVKNAIARRVEGERHPGLQLTQILIFSAVALLSSDVSPIRIP